MRFTLLPLLLCLASTCHADDDAIKASGSLDGKKVSFPAKSLAHGVKVTVDLLETCCDESVFDEAELKKAKQGDHVRIVLAKPLEVTVGREKMKVTEIILSQPMSSAVFWVRAGGKMRRFAKFDFRKEKPVLNWLAEARAE